jgi:hypothetical protein
MTQYWVNYMVYFDLFFLVEIVGSKKTLIEVCWSNIFVIEMVEFFFYFYE